MLRMLFVTVFALTLSFLGVAHAKPDNWMALGDIAKNEYELRITLRNSVEKILLESQFDALESAAASFRTSKSQFIDGEWRLNVLYDGLSYYLRTAPESNWAMRLAKLKEWVKVKPESITARVALAECLIGYAFHGRGGNYAKDVKDEQWQIYNNRISEAADVLKEAKNLKQTCPGWWAAYQRLALSIDMDRADYDQFVDSAIALEPNYNMYYFRKAWYLLPWWNGQEGDWEQYAKSSADSVGGDEGDILYARIVWFMDRRAPNNKVDNSAKVSWERVNRGIELIKQKKGNK